MHLLNGRYAVMDLSSGDVTENAVPEGYALSGSMALDHIDRILRERGDAFAICSGLLTASLIPAACAGFVRRLGDEPSADRICPITGNIGVELKLSGFDFIVLENSAEMPGYLWVRDGIAEFVPSAGMRDQDSWGRTDAIRSDQGDRKIQVMSTGPWADAGLRSSQLIMNYWGGEDDQGFAAEFGRRNLLAAAFRGMGELELEGPEGHLSSSVELQKRHISLLGRVRGLAAFSEAASGEGFSQLRHREVACFGCPFPCRTFYKIAEDPGILRLECKEPGYLAYDVPAVEKATSLGMTPRDVISAMISCARRGAAPLSVIGAVETGGSGTDLGSFGTVLDSQGPVSPASPASGAFSRSFEDPEPFLRCLALGLCPRYWARVGFDVESISLAAEPALGASLRL